MKLFAISAVAVLITDAVFTLRGSADCPLQLITAQCGPEQQYLPCIPANGMLPPPGAAFPPMYDMCKCIDWFPGSGLPWLCTARVSEKYLVTWAASLFPGWEVEQVIWCESEIVEVPCYRFPHCRNTGQFGGTEGSVLCDLGQLCSPVAWTTCMIKVSRPIPQRCDPEYACIVE